MTTAAWITLVAAASGPVLGSVHGTVRSEGTGEALAGVRVSVVSSSAEALSDASGTYSLGDLPSGRHLLRFSQFGYHDLTVEVTVPDGENLELDVRLRPRPIAVPPISVFAGPDGLEESSRSLGLLPPGARTLAVGGDPLTNEQDALLALETMPGVDIPEESPTGFHVRGGSADQNQLLVDGVPVYNAYHTSGVFTGINPDAVAAVALHAGALPARYGGRLSSVVELRTRRPGAAGFELRGGVGPADVRTTVETDLPGGGGALVAGRRTTYDWLKRGAYDRAASSAFDEMLTRVSLPALGGEIDFLALHGTNGLSFFNEPQADDAAPPTRYNRVRWTTDTDAVTWKWGTEEGATAQVSAWRAGTDTRGEWEAAGERMWLDHELTHLGLQVGAARTRPWGSLGFGIGAEHLSTSYVTRLIATQDLPQVNLDDDNQPDVAARATFDTATTSWTGYVDHQWIPHDRWLVDNGVRAVLGAGGGLDLEPRASVHYRPTAQVTLAAGYARMHQYAQSLRNEESILNAAFAFDPLVSAADPRVPVGRSDQVTASARFDVTEGLRLELEGYARRLDGLLLVAPATSHPFAIDSVEHGTGTAKGLGAALIYRGRTTDIDVIGDWASATRRTDELVYHPTFERKRSIAAAVARRLGSKTAVRTAFRAAAGRPTSGLQGGFQWEPFDPFTGEIEVGGTPIRRDGELNREKLPAYARLDLGVRRAWHVSLLGIEGELVTWLDVLNLLGRRNVVALTERPGLGGWEALRLSDTSVAFGAYWRF
jgi:hypothetical protein